MRSKLLSLCLISLYLASCQQDTLMHEYKHIHQDGWGKTDTLSFHIPPAKNAGDYGMYVGLRINHQFPYEALWFVVEASLSGTDIVQRDTIKYTLTENGKTLSGNGLNLLQYEQYAMKMSLQEGQEGDVRIYHVMSKERLPHLVDVGICIRH